jgi:hypothetical protein
VMVLRDSGHEGGGGLDTSEERRRVDDYADLPLLFRGRLGRLVCVEKRCDADSEVTTLNPPAICQRRIVRGRRRLRPVLVSSVETSSMANDEDVGRDGGGGRG